MSAGVPAETLLVEAPDGHLIFEEGECVYVSPAYRKVVAYPEHVSLGSEATNLRNLLHPKDRSKILDFFEQSVREKRKHITYTFRGLRYDGSYRWRQDSVHLVYDNEGAHVQSYIVARDLEGSPEEPVLDLRQGQAEERGREIMHRVKNDFELVRSLLSLQAQSESTDSGARAILEAADRVTSIGRTYETLHRSGDLQTVSIGELFHDVEPIVSEKAAAQGFELSLSVEEDERITVALAQTISIVTNELVTNSVKYVEKQSQPRIRVTVTRISQPTALVLRVVDNGQGYPADVLELDRAGFGLQIVHSLVEQHDGAVNLYNDHGAATEILLPIS